jgi:molybdopterin-guanine dinucleotide biosynthesis protein B
MDQTPLPPIVSIVGRPKVGKTTFLAKLVAELTERGYRVGVIKHSIHPFDAAQPGKDTWIHAQAGAVAVAFASANQLVISRDLDGELDIDAIAPTLGPLDLILTEGYKRAHKPKIEVSRSQLGSELVSPKQDLIAVVCDHEIDLDIPTFGLDDASQVANLLCQRFLR